MSLQKVGCIIIGVQEGAGRLKIEIELRALKVFQVLAEFWFVKVGLERGLHLSVINNSAT
jgi:sorbitol-specific phosphotransferase system component IIBC